MLKIEVNNLSDVTIFRCTGRITFGYEDTLLTAVSKQPDLRTMVLDLAEVTAIDAAGLGVLVSLWKWARASCIAFKLMNLTPKLEDLLELTNLRSVFEICSVPEMVGLLCRAFDQSQFAELEVAVESPLEVPDDPEPALVQ